MPKQASEENGKLDLKAAFVFGCLMTAIAERALVLMFQVPNSSFWSDYFGVLAMLAAPGVLPGVFVAGVAEGNPHGGGNSAVILLVATPINLGLYSVLALGVMKVVQRFGKRGNTTVGRDRRNAE